VEERDLFPQSVLDVIAAGIGLDDFPSGLRFGAVIRQEEGRGLMPQAGDDQLPRLARMALSNASPVAAGSSE